MDDNMHNPSDIPTPNPEKSQKSAAEYAEAFGKAVDVAEKVFRVAPLPVGAKRIVGRAMPTVKKAAKLAPTVAPVIEPYARKAAEQAKVVAPQVAQAAKTGAKHVAVGAQAGTKVAAKGVKTAAGHIHETAPKLGHAAADKASHLIGRIKHKKHRD